MRARPIGRANELLLFKNDNHSHCFNEGTANWPCKRSIAIGLSGFMTCFNEGTANWPCKREARREVADVLARFNEGTANWPCKRARGHDGGGENLASMRARPIGRANGAAPGRSAERRMASMRARPIGRANWRNVPGGTHG